MTVKELLEQRAKLIAEARAIHTKAEGENRDPSAEERSQFDKIMTEADALKAKADEQHRSATDRARLEKAEADLAESRGRQTDADQPGRQPGAEQRGAAGATETRKAFEAFLRSGIANMLPAELRSLTAETDTSGGYMTAPQVMVSELIKTLDNSVFMRTLATVLSVPSAQSLGAISLDADPDDANWTSELQTGNEDTAMGFGKRELHPHALAKSIKISRKLLRLAPSVESLVLSRLGYKFGVTEEQAYMTGDGVGKPLGVFVASNLGIPTTRDVSTDNTTTAITPDGLINAKYSLKEGYLRSDKLRWLFHRDAIKMLRKAKDSNGQYLWQPSLVAGTPDRLLDVPVIMSEYVPNTFTTGQYVGIIGDFSKYWIADATSLAIQRLDEYHAYTNQVGFIGRREVDGMPVLSEAFARVKLA